MKMIKQYINSYKFYITVFLTVLCAITTLMSVGFGALNQSLNISGDVLYDQHDQVLYNVFKRSANEGYAVEFTGSHDDSYTTTGTKSIYHWRSTNTVPSATIKDKWNVLFAGFCWQMYRTTDTGGVKLMYNGVPSEGKCNNTGTAQQIGTSTYNSSYKSLADGGYMYNLRYLPGATSHSGYSVINSTSVDSSKNYYYGSNVSYDSSTREYTLTGVSQNTWGDIYESSSGLYTCKSDSNTSCSSVWYIYKGYRTTIVGYYLQNGVQLSYYNKNMYFGTGYTESNGTYTLTGVKTSSRGDYYENYRDYIGYYFCNDPSQTSCTQIRRIHNNTSSYIIQYVSSDNEYLFSTGFSYNSSTNQYTLNSTGSELIWDYYGQRDSVRKHYTCRNKTGTCTNIYYVFNVENSFYTFYFMSLSGGKSINDAIDDMLYVNNVNTTNSNIKTYIENWYQNNLTSYTSKLEDTIFCNGRGLSSDWGGTEYFSFYDGIDCKKDTDKFSINNPKARLTYPVGLPTRAELQLLNSTALVKTGSAYHIMNPSYFSYNASSSTYGLVRYSADTGGYILGDSYHNHDTAGVRPVISLKPGTLYTSGNGSQNTPYIVQ